MVAVVARDSKRFSGLRPLEPGRDLAGVADLIEEAFAHDLDLSGRATLDEMRALARLGPLLSIVDKFGSSFSDLLSGFVWLEGGQIVGNVTVTQVARGSTRWLISNVAVSRPYRGHGIGRTLVDAAIEFVKECRGQTIGLQVRDDNPHAIHIYKSFGFEEIATTTHLRLDRVHPVATLPPREKKALIRRRRYNDSDSFQAYQLARAFVPFEVQAETPLRRSSYYIEPGTYLSDLFNLVFGQKSALRLVAEINGQFGAAITVEVGNKNREHDIKLMVHPYRMGLLEEAMISRALNHLARWPYVPVVVQQPSTYTKTINAFKSFGFRERRNLTWMKMRV